MKGYKLTLLLGVASFLWVGCGSQSDENELLIRKVKVSKVQSISGNAQKSFSGIVKEARSVNLSFRVAGPLAKVHVNEGDFVKKGDLVAEINTRDYALQLSVAQAEFEKVTSETSRVVELYKRNGVTEADYQKAVAGEKMITAQLNRAKDQFADTKLLAPFSGYIQSLNYEVGEIVNIGMPVASFIDLSAYHVEVDIPASLFVVRDRFIDFSCRLNLPDSKKIPLKFLSNQAKANSSQLYQLVFQLNPKADKRVAPGMEVKVLINYNLSSEKLCSVPLNAVFNSDGKACIWVLNQTDSTVSITEVVSGDLIGDGHIQIVSGLKGNEIIVVAGVNLLNDGEKVDIIKPVSETNIGGLL